MPALLNASQKVELLQLHLDEYGLRCMIETGLYSGHGSGMELRGLDHYYIIDVQESNAEIARAAGYRVLVGDSAQILPGLLRLIDEPCLFWLDAHAIDDDPDWPPCPVLAELAAVTAHRDQHELEHVILIDDLRQFRNGTDASLFRDAPTVDEIRACATSNGWKVVEADDIMRLLP